MYTTIANSVLFKGLSAKRIEEIMKDITFQIKKFQKEDMLAMTGETVSGAYLLLDGSVRGEMVDFDGKIVKIEDIEGKRILAPAFLFGRATSYPVNIVANNDVQTLFFPKPSFIQLLQTENTVLMNYLNIISNRGQFLSEKMKFLTFQSIKGKFAHYLISQLEKSCNNGEVVLKHSQEKMADLFGVTRPALGRVIALLNKEGVIQTKGKKVVILDLEALKLFVK